MSSLSIQRILARGRAIIVTDCISDEVVNFDPEGLETLKGMLDEEIEVQGPYIFLVIEAFIQQRQQTSPSK